jgi:hypothetical protein
VLWASPRHCETHHPTNPIGYDSTTGLQFLTLLILGAAHQCCDVFIWVAVFRDEIVLWIMNSDEVSSHEHFSAGQHRGNSGNEGQLHVTRDNIELFDQYELKTDDIEGAIKAAMKRRRSGNNPSEKA